MSDSLGYEQDGHVVTLTLNRPERMNALGGDLIPALGEAWDRIGEDRTVRVVILTGAGRGFCSGADLAGGGMEKRAEDGRPAEDLGKPRHPSLNPRFTARHKRMYKPVITAVNGVCAGAGMHFVVDSDIVIAAKTATFVDTHVSVGFVSALEPIGLSRKIPLGAVTRMIAMGRHERLSAQRAYELGLVSEVVEDGALLARANELAAAVATASPTTLEKSLRAVWEGLDVGLEEALDNGWNILSSHWDHPDIREGAAAFVEKRDPNWA